MDEEKGHLLLTYGSWSACSESLRVVREGKECRGVYVYRKVTMEDRCGRRELGLVYSYV